MDAERAAQGKLASGGPGFDRIAPDDLPALMVIERLPGYDTLVGRWETAKHEAEMANPGTRYFALREDDRLAGFAIVQLDVPDRRAHLKRIAGAEPGRGDGGRLLRGLIDHLFTETETDRLDRKVFEDNDRAKRAYEKAGFTAEGLLREHHRMADGSLRGVWLMSLLRREWLSAHGGGLNPGPART